MVSERRKLVFLLWGAHAQKHVQEIDLSGHCVFTAPHPSPLSAHRGFLGCAHFSQTNKWLVEQANDLPIRWYAGQQFGETRAVNVDQMNRVNLGGGVWYTARVVSNQVKQEVEQDEPEPDSEPEPEPESEPKPEPESEPKPISKKIPIKQTY